MDFEYNSGRVISFSFNTICFILSMIFMILKLCGVITWSWVMVFLPMIISAGLTLIIFIIAFIIVLITSLNE